MSDWGYIPEQGYYGDLQDYGGVPIEFYGGGWYAIGDGLAISAAMYEEMQHQAYLATQGDDWLPEEGDFGVESIEELESVDSRSDLSTELLLLVWDF